MYVVGSCVLGVLLLLTLFNRSKPSPRLPGLTPSDPETGNMQEVNEAGSLTHFQMKQHSRFGGVFSFYMGRMQVVSIADPHYMRDIAHLDVRAYPVFQFLEDWIGPSSIQFASPVEYWRRRKAYIDPAFGLRGIQQYEHELIALFTQECFPKWEQIAGKPLDLKEICLETALKSITLTAFGSELQDTQEIRTFMSAYNSIWDYLYAKLNGTDSPVSVSTYTEAKNIVNGLCKRFISQRNGKFEAFRFIDLLLKQGEKELIESEMVTFLVGGFHTTGYSVMWLLYFLAKYPLEQEKVAKEVGKSGLETLSSGVLYEAGFEGLRNFVEETIRLGQVAPTSARVSATPVRLHDGKVIPADTPIIEALAILSASPGLWSNSTEFYPDRFLSPVDPLTFRPFGGTGKRVCPGKTLSYTWLYLFLANLLKRFRVEFEPGADTRVDMTYRIVSSLKNTPKIVFQRRQFAK